MLLDSMSWVSRSPGATQEVPEAARGDESKPPLTILRKEDWRSPYVTTICNRFIKAWCQRPARCQGA